jgi:ATP adenylyltransferase
LAGEVSYRTITRYHLIAKGPCMKRLYAPWRTSYATNTAHKKDINSPAEECIFCLQRAENNDENHFILKRFDHTFVILNRFPYNAGHLMVIPYRHVPMLEQLSKEERAELMEVISLSASILAKTLGAHGCNIGLNLGKAAGAGMPAHLHMHLVPRWEGDTNFMPLLADTKVVSVDLPDTYKKLKKPFQESVL